MSDSVDASEKVHMDIPPKEQIRVQAPSMPRYSRWASMPLPSTPELVLIHEEASFFVLTPKKEDAGALGSSDETSRYLKAAYYPRFQRTTILNKEDLETRLEAFRKSSLYRYY
jgi:hypothetical protein